MITYFRYIANFSKNIKPLQDNQTKDISQSQYHIIKRSIDNSSGTLAYAMFLPKEWKEEQVRQALDPTNKIIKSVKLVKDNLSCSNGKALIEVNKQEDLENLCRKYQEQLLDTKDTLQRIAIKPFKLKFNEEKPIIQRKVKQAYITGLPRDMQNEDLLELLIDFGDVENVQIPKDNDQKRNKGYAFVLFKKAEEAKRFQMFMSGKEFLGKKLRVQLEKFEFDSQKKCFINKSDKLFKDQDYERFSNFDETIKNLRKMQNYATFFE